MIAPLDKGLKKAEILFSKKQAFEFWKIITEFEFSCLLDYHKDGVLDRLKPNATNEVSLFLY